MKKNGFILIASNENDAQKISELFAKERGLGEHMKRVNNFMWKTEDLEDVAEEEYSDALHEMQMSALIDWYTDLAHELTKRAVKFSVVLYDNMDENEMGDVL